MGSHDDRAVASILDEEMVSTDRRSGSSVVVPVVIELEGRSARSRIPYRNRHHPPQVAQVVSLALVCGTRPEGEGSAACECGQGEINGRFDVKAGGGEDRNGAVRCRDQQLDFGTT
jgi:hypothetical protein